MMGTRKTLAAVGTILVVAGCGMNPHRDDGSCQGYLDEGVCSDLRETYESTHEFDREAYRAKLREQAQEGNGGAPEDRDEQSLNGIVGYQPLVEADDQPRPMLRPAIPVRVWIAPYEDASGKLHVPGYVYARATEPEWEFGEEVSQDSRVALPLVRD